MTKQKRNIHIMIKFTKSELNNIVNKMRSGAYQYVAQNHISAMVLGISGGIDSALAAAILQPVCLHHDIPLIGASITIESNTDAEQLRAKNIGTVFCTDFFNIDMTNMFHHIKAIDSPTYRNVTDSTALQTKIRYGNIKARMRMIYLYNVAAANRGMVISTDNLTELNLGFWTLHGDVGDFGPFQQLWKTEVYRVAEYLCNTEFADTKARDALYACINADATDGLGISKTDLDQLLPDWRERHSTTREGYEEVDDVLISYLSDKRTLNQTIIDRHLATEFKRNNPYNLARTYLTT